MKLFQRLLVAPAAIGLFSPIAAANATDFNFSDVSNYSSGEEIKSIKSFSKILPTDWSYKAITNLALERGCPSIIPNEGLSRYEAATILNSCLGNVSQLTELESRLVSEFNPELSNLNSRIEKLENQVKEFEAGSFSTTTSASFGGNFVIGAKGGVPVGSTTEKETTQTGYDYSIDLTTSFTGEDSLDVTIIAGDAGADLSEADLDDTNDVLTLDGISYTFPVGEKTNTHDWG